MKFKKKEIKQFENVHWADLSAERVITQFPNEKIYTLASGITPSGYIHIGNFRELITSEFVRRALENKGKKTKFLYSWDSYDAFRKVPFDVPSDWKKYLRMPDGEVPNPFGEGTYAREFMETFQKEVKIFNFPIIFQNQFEIQRSGIYAENIKKVLQNKQKIIDILNKFRKEFLVNSWMPIDIYDDETKKDSNKILSYDGEYTLTYINENGKEKTVNFKKEPRVKLRWKADWPMRWAYYNVNFEPGGKDHSTPGSSYTVGKEIVKELFNREAPVYTMYDFVRVKGQGGKISSSKGGALRVKDVLEIYTPKILLYLFSSKRPNSEFDISFDLDVIKIYEDFDKLERLYFDLEEEKNLKKLATKKRIYELSLLEKEEIQKKIPFQPQFRHLITIIQANDFNYKKVELFFKKNLKTKYDEDRLKERFNCVKNWLELYAPQEMKFQITKKISKQLTKKQKEILFFIKNLLKKIDDDKELFLEFKNICEKFEISISDFFKFLYKTIINKEKGPKLAKFMIENKQKILKLLEQI